MRKFCSIALLASASACADAQYLSSSAEAWAACWFADGSSWEEYQIVDARDAVAYAQCGEDGSSYAAASVGALQFGDLSVGTYGVADGLAMTVAAASASFEDWLTIAGGVGSGRLVWEVDGFASGYHSDAAFWAPDSFTYGESFPIWGSVHTASSPHGYGFDGYAYLQVRNVRITDDQGNLLPAGLYAASRQRYPYEALPAPEPSSLVLLACAGLLVLAALRRKLRAA